MQEGDFTVNKMGYYTPANVVANDFLNEKLENEQYGLYYSVRFEGDAETFLWQSKTKPVEGEPVWGHIEPSKSGKSMRFKKDKKEDEVQAKSTDTPAPSFKNDKFLRDVTAIPLDVYRVRANIDGLPTNADERAIFFENIKEDANELLALIDEVRNAD